MLEEEIVSCPICEHELAVKIMKSGKNLTYVVPDACNNCKTPADKLENLLNKSTKRGYTKTEKSYLKLDPRARG